MALFCAAFLSGCGTMEDLTDRRAWRWGPSSVINAEETNDKLLNQIKVLDYIAKHTRIQPGYDDSRWFEIAEWGFNIGREDCNVYLNNLFKLARQKERTKGLLLDVSAAVTGIVTAASPQSKALSFIAPAFGLAGNVNDKVLNAYLFADAAPGLVSIKVHELQVAYRNSQSRQTIRSGAAAYNAIQTYYQHCLPQNIEGIFVKTLAGAEASATKTGTTSAGANLTAPAN